MRSAREGYGRGVGRGPTRRLLLLGLAPALATLMPGCRRARPLARVVPPGATVLALGDSLTAGTGAAPEGSYPAVLARLTGWTVVNAGVPGDTAAGARERLPALLAQHRPALVIVSIGGNDFLRRVPEVETRAAVEALCRQALEAGAQVLLVAVPRPSLLGAAAGTLTDHPMYADIARALALPLQREGWAEVLGDASLRADPIHANAQGYRQFARSLAGTAVASGLLPRPD